MRKYLALGAFVAVFALLGGVYVWQMPSKRALLKRLDPLECDLAQKACEYEYNGSKITIDITPRPIYTLQEQQIIVRGLGEFKHLNAQIYGLNMYMGTISDEFERIDGAYVGTVRLSTCQAKIMRYRLELFDGDKSLGVYGDFDLVTE